VGVDFGRDVGGWGEGALTGPEREEPDRDEQPDDDDGIADRADAAPAVLNDDVMVVGDVV